MKNTNIKNKTLQSTCFHILAFAVYDIHHYWHGSRFCVSEYILNKLVFSLAIFGKMGFYPVLTIPSYDLPHFSGMHKEHVLDRF